MHQPLIDTLNQVGKSTHVYHSPDGTEVLVLPYGGRILGLFSPESEENFFWTHSALESAAAAAEFYASDQWHNSGGDRTWLAPEVDFFFPQFPQTDLYWQPRALDPGDWQISVDAHAVRLVNRLTHRLSRFNAEVALEMTKSVSPALNPLRQERMRADISDVEYAGYTLRTSLAWTQRSAGRTGRVVELDPDASRRRFAGAHVLPEPAARAVWKRQFPGPGDPRASDSLRDARRRASTR